MTLIPKLLSLGALISGAVGVAILKPWQKDISVKQELEKLNKTILTSKTDSRWEIKAHTYKSIIATDSKLKIDGKDTISKEDLSNWCLDAFKKPHSQELTNKAQSFCLAPTVKDKLSKNNKSIPSSLGTQLEDYKKHASEDSLVIPKGEIENKEKNDLSEDDLKKWCSTYSEVELLDGEDKNYNRIEKWCTST
ncbi:hypothetical protein MHF_0232 [Mycoplasma haemofelis Ohio2]|uniref:Uncharacterized protein n=1 Tax=Mycoplasma haemofelis (strain Ohio2) TaxID=859194 RepID=F6FGD7_MYCHI|nr:hypothetical protein MHF_0232 [Mycoplasma haemofelis Ohio2]